MPRSFTFTSIRAGWVDAEITISSGVQTVDGSYLSDAIRDFADALASLATAQTATCRWHQEPGELEWSFNRSGDDLVIAASLLLHGDRQPCFECPSRYHDFCRDVLVSLHDLRNSLGLLGYEKEWGYPFPVEAALKLENAIVPT
jgi:hypothetical protein